MQDALKLIEPTGKPVRQIVRIFIEIMDLFAYTGSMPVSFTQNLIVDADFEEEESTDNDGSGLIETSLQDIFEL